MLRLATGTLSSAWLSWVGLRCHHRKGGVIMDDRAFIRGLEGFHNRRFLLLTFLGVLVFAVVMTVVVAGFRKNHGYRSADTVTLVQPWDGDAARRPIAFRT